MVRTFHRVSMLVFCLGALVLGVMTPPLGATNLFGLIDTGELYRSTDGGAAWTGHATLPVRDAVGLAASATASNLMIVTRSGSVYASFDAGASWSATGTVTASDVASFTILPDAAVLAVTESGTIYKSSDGGVSFSGFATISASNCVSIARGQVGHLYVLARTGEVYRSQDGGASWTPISGVTVSNAVSIRRKVAELFVLTETGEIYRSLNEGVSWLPVGAITASNMSAMVANGGRVLAAARTGEIYQSTSGITWTLLGAVNQLNVVSLGTDEPLATGVDVEEGSPPRFMVRAPYPNPSSSGDGTFPITLDRPARVRLEIYDAHGRLLAARAQAPVGAGPQAIRWAPKGLRAGRYFVRYVLDEGSAATAWTVVR
jgi:photosystem II stability/assembly factor-like uncharacterized protein